jgi:hypothetical protein
LGVVVRPEYERGLARAALLCGVGAITLNLEKEVAPRMGSPEAVPRAGHDLEPPPPAPRREKDLGAALEGADQVHAF